MLAATRDKNSMVKVYHEIPENDITKQDGINITEQFGSGITII